MGEGFQQPQPKLKRRLTLKQWCLISVCSSLAVIIIAIISISVYVGWSLTHPDRKTLDETPTDYGLQYDDIQVTSGQGSDEVTLKGWHVFAETDEPKGTIIFAHGYRNNRLQDALPALALAKAIVTEDYEVVLFDFRNSGDSEGDQTTVGFKEQEDLISVIQYAHRKSPDLPIGVIGFSMGASTALMTAQKESLVSATVADSPFSDLREYLESNLSYWSNLPNFPFTPVILGTLPALTGIEVDQVSPRGAEEPKSPVLLIHGDGDEAIPYENSLQIQQAYESQTELWVPQGSDHVESFADYPEAYTERVIQFFDQHLASDHADEGKETK
ncbi:alpha/beta hydrolase [Caldalkalibacillus salinus]|uniref:alpha/beta hydrolase n=1 Tax=Caldalkalibacillus salinus TaxID=2803787 RepID=UPI001923C553|nr:alpha/beta fold hydrolase [Caldalkalibacillus salinus]